MQFSELAAIRWRCPSSCQWLLELQASACNGRESNLFKICCLKRKYHCFAHIYPTDFSQATEAGLFCLFCFHLLELGDHSSAFTFLCFSCCFWAENNKSFSIAYTRQPHGFILRRYIIFVLFYDRSIRMR